MCMYSMYAQCTCVFCTHTQSKFGSVLSVSDDALPSLWKDLEVLRKYHDDAVRVYYVRKSINDSITDAQSLN